MKKRKKVFTIFFSILLVFMMMPVSSAVYADEIIDDAAQEARLMNNEWMVRIAGDNRYQTSIAIATKYLEETGKKSFSNVIIATGDNFPDALAASPLSAAYEAPIILVSSKSEQTYKDAISFIKNNVNTTGQVFIVTGNKLMPDNHFNDLVSLGYKLNRLAGTNRYDTNINILYYLAQKTPGYDCRELLICSGNNWPDAAVAAATGKPIMLVNTTSEQITMKQMGYLGYMSKAYRKPELTVIGGSGAVPEMICTRITNSLGPVISISRVSGKNRAETAVAVAKRYFGESPLEKIVLAYGANYPDTITGGFFANKMNAPILYADNKAPGSYVSTTRPYATNAGVQFAYVLGGPTLVSDMLARDIIMPEYN